MLMFQWRKAIEAWEEGSHVSTSKALMKSLLLPRVFIHYHAQVLTGSMCVYTSYIVPHVAASTVGTRLFRTVTGPLGARGAERGHHPN